MSDHGRGVGGVGPGPFSISESFDEAVERHFDREAVRSGAIRLTYGELDRQVNQAGHVLRSAGLRRGSTVAASTANGHQVLVAFLAAMRLGMRWVGLNRVLPLPEKRAILRHAGARFLLLEADDASEWEVGGGRPGLGLLTVGPGGSWDRLVDQAPDRRAPGRVDPLAAASVSYTSGTTGRPKGVLQSQHNLALPARYLALTGDFEPSARPGVCLPLTILNVIVSATLPGLFSGAGCVILARPEARTVAAAVAGERITTLTMPSPVLFDLCTLEDVSAEQLATLDRPRTGGGELPDEVRERYLARYGQDIVATYGLTEAPTVVAQERRGQPHVPGSSGQVVDYLEVRTIGSDGTPLGDGQTGELCLGARSAGPWAGRYRPFLGYWRRPAATRAAFAGELVRTGDLGRVDGAGHLYVTDRKTNLIVRGGANVYPAQVERAIRALPGVVDCVVVGLPDLRLGERVAAAVQVRPGSALAPEDVADHCRSRLARYQVPERILLVADLPRNAMAKAVRGEVKELLAHG